MVADIAGILIALGIPLLVAHAFDAFRASDTWLPLNQPAVS
jgi:hypothetical protein